MLAAGPDEAALRRGIGRFLHVDDVERISAYRELLTQAECPAWKSLDTRRQRYARMLAAQLGDQVFSKDKLAEDAWPVLWRHPQVRSEAAELLAVLERGGVVLLFARLHDTDRAFWLLGPVEYVDHHGEKPMAITWRLEHPLPADLFAQFAAAVA